MLKMMNRVEPWKYGQDISGAVDVESAISLADMNWEVVQTPALIRLADGNILETPMKVNVRSDNNAFLGVVSDRYQTVQNKDAFSFLTYLTDFKFVSAGIVSGGKTIWMCVEVPSFSVLGESMNWLSRKLSVLSRCSIKVTLQESLKWSAISWSMNQTIGTCFSWNQKGLPLFLCQV